MKNKIRTGRLFSSLILSTAIISVALLPAALAASVTISANPDHGTIGWFPAIPEYYNFASTLTVTGSVSGTPTWTYAPATGSPSCANYISVSFGNANAWNTTATFNDHSAFSCNATIILKVTSTTGLIESIGVQVTYDYCRNCL